VVSHVDSVRTSAATADDTQRIISKWQLALLQELATKTADAKTWQDAGALSAEALAEIDRAKTAFFSNVSHEFRTLLTLILGPIEEMLARANGSFTGSREELELVHRNTRRLLKLVNTLLDFSRIEAGRVGARLAIARLQRRARVIIEDVQTDPDFVPHRQIAASAGYRAVQSIPLFSRNGQPLGRISAHFRKPHRPSQRELRLTDLYARQAAEMIEHKPAEAARQASVGRFRHYFDLGLIGMAITSPTKECLEVNDELCRILGYERNELLQKTWAEMTHPDDLAADLANFNRVMAGECDGYSLDKRWIRKDGGVIDSIAAAKCFRRADGSVDHFVGMVLDITERKRAEQAGRHSARET
jgi:PAS domain S-box-containing protein